MTWLGLLLLLLALSLVLYWQAPRYAWATPMLVTLATFAGGHFQKGWPQYCYGLETMLLVNYIEAPPERIYLFLKTEGAPFSCYIKWSAENIHSLRQAAVAARENGRAVRGQRNGLSYDYDFHTEVMGGGLPEK